MATLRPCMAPLIGNVYEFVWSGSGDGTPYEDQQIWLWDRKHDDDLPVECRGRWVPDEDLEDVVVEQSTNLEGE